LIRRLVLLALACASSSIAGSEPDRVWLVIAASNASAEGIAHRAKAVARALPSHLVVQTRDCGARDNVFALAVVAESAEAARALLPGVQPIAADAYVKRCDVVPRSLLALRATAIDPSIYDVPDDAVNWDDDARISTSVPLADGRVVIIQRYFVNDPEDPLEGRRERVLLPLAPKSKILQNDCPSAEAFSVRAGRIAFQCAREQAGDALLHEVIVVATDGAVLATVPHCRSPRFASTDRITCDAETVDAEGRLALRKKRIELPRAAAAASKR
jgi:hypothetical protein